MTRPLAGRSPPRPPRETPAPPFPGCGCGTSRAGRDGTLSRDLRWRPEGKVIVQRRSYGLLGFALLAAATSGCSRDPAQRAAADAHAPLYNGPSVQKVRHSDALITISHSGCMGGCPAYQITILPDGRVEWWGSANVDVAGTREDRVSVDRVAELRQEFKAVGFGALPSMYATGVSDVSWTTLCYSGDGPVKCVEHQDPVALEFVKQGDLPPKSLVALEENILRVTHYGRWRGEGLRPGAHSTNHYGHPDELGFVRWDEDNGPYFELSIGRSGHVAFWGYRLVEKCGDSDWTIQPGQVTAVERALASIDIEKVEAGRRYHGVRPRVAIPGPFGSVRLSSLLCASTAAGSQCMSVAMPGNWASDGGADDAKGREVMKLITQTVGADRLIHGPDASSHQELVAPW